MDTVNHADVLVIGSGFGGSFAARNLTRSGYKVVLLERGPWRKTTPTASIGVADPTPLPQGRKMLTHLLRSVRLPVSGMKEIRLNKRGFFEGFFGHGLWLFCTSNVGGGSHAFAGLLSRPLVEDFWDGFHPDLTSETMEPYYDQVLETLRPIDPTERVEEAGWRYQIGEGQPLREVESLRRPASFLLAEPGLAPKAQVGPNDVRRRECEMDNNSFLGSGSGAKTTLDAAVIWPAMKDGLVVMDMCEALSIHQTDEAEEARTGDDDGTRYVVKFRDLKKNADKEIRARFVVVAAGGLNSVRLLMASRGSAKGLRDLPGLGQRIGGNGDFFGFWKENAPLDLSRGLPVGPAFRPAKSLYESYMVRAGFQGVDGYPLPRFIKRWLRRQSILIAMASEKAEGTSRFVDGRYYLDYQKEVSPGVMEVADWVSELEAATSTKVFSTKVPISVHPLGGACIGATSTQGVVDGTGQVFGCPGLYVADSAAFPGAPGGPPSLSIAAWGAYVADCLARSDRRNYVAESDEGFTLYKYN
ncbi:GMC oxidoreductase [Sphingobium sp. Cam5-1]|uniref:GMC oxidoreductase n=1 Tax=Sphingobium sp. Cam5-1 TaxID=2789327 RepID=UPI0018AD17E6|nr:GMC oxidoreductase [Sphingobium sp. Cam5-1]QPI72235.1 GMC family oxidoreductase [Sphingobium sp. Cam5-1]